MMERNKMVQKNIFYAVLSCLFLNTGVVLSTLGKGFLSSKPMLRVVFGAAILTASRVPVGLLNLKKLDDYNKRYGVKKS